MDINLETINKIAFECLDTVLNRTNTSISEEKFEELETELTTLLECWFKVIK